MPTAIFFCKLSLVIIDRLETPSMSATMWLSGRSDDVAQCFGLEVCSLVTSQLLSQGEVL